MEEGGRREACKELLAALDGPCEEALPGLQRALKGFREAGDAGGVVDAVRLLTLSQRAQAGREAPSEFIEQ